MNALEKEVIEAFAGSNIFVGDFHGQTVQEKFGGKVMPRPSIGFRLSHFNALKLYEPQDLRRNITWLDKNGNRVPVTEPVTSTLGKIIIPVRQMLEKAGTWLDRRYDSFTDFDPDIHTIEGYRWLHEQGIKVLVVSGGWDVNYPQFVRKLRSSGAWQHLDGEYPAGLRPFEQPLKHPLNEPNPIRRKMLKLERYIESLLPASLKPWDMPKAAWHDATEPLPGLVSKVSGCLDIENRTGIKPILGEDAIEAGEAWSAFGGITFLNVSQEEAERQRRFPRPEFLDDPSIVPNPGKIIFGVGAYRAAQILQAARQKKITEAFTALLV